MKNSTIIILLIGLFAIGIFIENWPKDTRTLEQKREDAYYHCIRFAGAEYAPSVEDCNKIK